MIILADKEGMAVIRAIVDAGVAKGIFQNLHQVLAVMGCVRELPESKESDPGVKDEESLSAEET
uniref:Uncharacterized protein n=1 Tax=viral metagenome TaxID=1070528 RepID=A0A6M3KRT3_9ZZZZ